MKNAEKLLKTIKVLIEREVKKQVKSTLNEMVVLKRSDYDRLLESVVSQPSNQSNDVFTKVSKDIQSHLNTRSPNKLVPKTGNSVLDEILQNTRGGIMSEYNTAVGSSDIHMTTADVYNFGTPQTGGQLPIQTTGLSSNSVVDLDTESGKSLAKALTRNYSDVLKKVSEKKGY